MPRKQHGATTSELRARFESLDERLAGLREELGSLFELVLENRSRLAHLEEQRTSKPARRRSTRGSRRSRRRRKTRSR